MKKLTNLRKAEARTGVLMVLPAVVIILAISLYPIFQTFIYSMFDYRINNPEKSSLSFSTTLDLNRLANAEFYVGRTMSVISDQKTPANQEKIEKVEKEIKQLNTTIFSVKGLNSQYATVKKYFDNMQPLPDKSIQYITIDPSTANSISNQVVTIENQLKGFEKTTNDSYSQAAQVVDSIQQSINYPNFIGLRNYSTLFQEPRLGKAVLNTVMFTIITVFVELVLGLLIAQIVNFPFRFKGGLRAVMLVPWAIPTVVSALMWKFMFDGQTGIFSNLLAALGLVKDPGLILGTPGGSSMAIIVADIWKTTPYMALLILAGLQQISGELYESAQIDGASAIQRFFKITLPLIKPTVLVALLFRSLDAFRVFDLIYVMTGGGPGNSTESLSAYSYKVLFSQMNFGQGSAIAIITFICVAVISGAYVKMLGTDLTGKAE